MATKTSSITTFTAGGIAADKLTIAVAGAVIDAFAGKTQLNGGKVVGHLYNQTDRKNPEQARLANSGKGPILPSPVPAGTYDLDLRLQGETPSARFIVVVRDKIVTPPPNTPPDKDDDGSGVTTYKLTGAMALGLSDLAHTAYSAMKPLVDPLRLDSLRVWWDSKGFKGFGSPDDEFKNAQTYARGGFDPIYCCAQDGCTPDMFGRAAEYLCDATEFVVRQYDADPATKGKVVRWEVLNEPDLTLDDVDAAGKVTKRKKYYTGTIAKYVEQLRAVYVALKAKFGARVQVIAAGFSWDIDALESIEEQLRHACDAIAFHGYPKSLGKAEMDKYVRVVALARRIGKLAIVTEGSPGYGKRRKGFIEAAAKHRKAGRAAEAAEQDELAADVLIQWAVDWPKYLVALELIGVDECILFNAYDIGTTNSAGAMFDAKHQPTPSYERVKAAVFVPTKQAA